MLWIHTGLVNLIKMRQWRGLGHAIPNYGTMAFEETTDAGHRN